MEADLSTTVTPGFRPESRVYVNNGFRFYFNGASDTTIYFKCASSRCPGRAKWRIGSVFERTIPHNHMNDFLRSEVLYFRRIIIDRARALTYVSFSEIIHQERSRISNRDVRSQLTYRTLRPSMQRARGSVFPNIPANLRALTAIHQDPSWEHLCRTSDGLDSIYSGSVDALDGSHCIIYCSERSLQVLKGVNIIFADGTFFITPAINNCYQVFTIVAVSGHTVIPLVWCLMETKTQAAYSAVLVHLRLRMGHWNFTEAVCDFEDAMVNSIQMVFEVEVHGCYFHYVNSLGRWVRMHIPYTMLCDYEEVVDIVRYCCALPLLPRQFLIRGFNVIIDVAMDLGLYMFVLCFPFLHYVETNWINHATRGQTLSVAGSVHRTNNASESNNNRMNRRVQRAHPNAFHLVHIFVEFEDETIDDLNSLARGWIPTRPRTSQSISNDEFITSLTTQLLRENEPTDEHLLNFMHSVAYSVNNVVLDAMFNH